MLPEGRGIDGGGQPRKPATRLLVPLAGGAGAVSTVSAAGQAVASTSAVAVPADLAWVVRFPAERQGAGGSTYARVKRAIDLGLIGLLSPVLAAALLACYAAVKLGSPRAPALFVQERTGRDGARFRMFKFRTMVPNAENLKAGLREANKLRWPDFKIDEDPRITRVGRFLRTTSLDELPQVVNVLRGEMSLVGPRPTSFGVETYQEWHKARLAAVPGVTGLWQIAGRGEMEFDERVRLDVAYIERRCFLLDLSILLRTVGAVLARRGAH